MANKLITMNKIRQIIRLHTQAKGKTFISEQTGVSRNTVKKYVRIFKRQAKIEKQDLLILDDFGIQPIDAQGRASLMEIIEDRHGNSSLIITAQLAGKTMARCNR